MKDSKTDLSNTNHPLDLFFLVTLVLAGIFYMTGLGEFQLFDWDEINFAESSREMLLTKDYFKVQINFQPFWEKPPLFFWLQTLSMKIFGISEYAARFPNAIFGIFTLIVLYATGRKIIDRQFGLVWVLLYIGSLLPHLYFKSGIIDPVFNFFIFLGVLFGIRLISEASAKTLNGILTGLFIGLAVLTKGPVGLLIPLLTFISYWTYTGFKKLMSLKDLSIIGLTILILSFAWYGAELIQNGPWFMKEFIAYQIELFTEPVAGHKQPWFYHFLVVFLGCFPLSIFALAEFYYRESNVELSPGQDSFRYWMLSLFWVVMILFTIVSTKIVHYSSMAYLPLSYLAALNIHKRISADSGLKKFELLLFIIIGLIIGLVITLLPILASKPELIIPYINDPFAVDSFNIDISWSGYEFLIGAIFLIGLLISSILFMRKRMMLGLSSSALALSITLLLASFYILPKVTSFSQGPAVEFWKSIEDEDGILKPIGYKSYAHYYYGNVNSDHGKYIKDTEDAWLSDTYDKPIYYMTKSTFKSLESYPDVKLIGAKGGFKFYKKDVDNR